MALFHSILWLSIIPLCVCVCVYTHTHLADSANVNFDKSYSLYKLFTKENEKILPVKCPAHLIRIIAKKGVIFLPVLFTIRVFFCHFQVSSKHTEAINKILTL